MELQAEGSLLRYGIIGVGMMGREHQYNLAAIPGALVVAVADPDPGSRQQAVAVASALQLSRPAPPLEVFADHGSLLDSGLCDVVVVATPNMTHAQILLDILNHPKSHHILVEKPLCTTVEDCYLVMEAAQSRPEVLVQVGLEYRYIPAVAKLIEQVKIGSIGHVRMVSIREHRFPFLVKVNNWNRFNRNSGGTLVEKCCHFFDLMTLIVDSRPVRVMASGAQDINHLDEIYDGEGEAFVPESIVRIGARDSGRAGVLTYEVHDKRVKYEGLHHGSSFLEHLEFAAAIKSHGEHPPTVGLEAGLMSVAVGVAAQLSIELGRFVALSEVLDRKRS
ncbi:hypothetical protein CY35_07G100500 [Sphagnum magellanicum]|uniref:Uncharacterized protein n=1 Tax=Sphagnum magellanicum TaxID=128215 RepID=A0ACB8HPS6_9BRYO|nr:hypothetical protein CY35_07G100500 [Sphagnum magellanicum]